MSTKKTATVETVDEDTEFVQDAGEVNTADYEAMYNDEKVKTESLEADIKKMQEERENIVKQYNDLAKKYERLFNLYANNLDYYLNGTYIKENNQQ